MVKSGGRLQVPQSTRLDETSRVPMDQEPEPCRWCRVSLLHSLSQPAIAYRQCCYSAAAYCRVQSFKAVFSLKASCCFSTYEWPPARSVAEEHRSTDDQAIRLTATSLASSGAQPEPSCVKPTCHNGHPAFLRILASPFGTPPPIPTDIPTIEMVTPDPEAAVSAPNTEQRLPVIPEPLAPLPTCDGPKLGPFIQNFEDLKFEPELVIRDEYTFAHGLVIKAKLNGRTYGIKFVSVIMLQQHESSS